LFWLSLTAKERQMTTKEQQRQSAVVWFEIPANDLARATSFYEQILPMKMRPYQGVGAKMNVFPYTEPAIGGAVIEGGGAGHARASTSTPIQAWTWCLPALSPPEDPFFWGARNCPPGMGVFAQVEDNTCARDGSPPPRS